MVQYKYRYPNENWQTIEGDRYSNELRQIQYYWYGFAEATSTGRSGSVLDCGQRIELISKSGVSGIPVSANIVSRTDSFGEFLLFELKYKSSPTSTLIRTSTLEIGYQPRPGVIEGSRTRVYSDCDIGVVRVAPGSWGGEYFADVQGNKYPVGGSQCTFTVFNSSQIVHQETRGICPEVEEIQQQTCPPGTCQVDCGNVYCCYGSNGIAVSSFSK